MSHFFFRWPVTQAMIVCAAALPGGGAAGQTSRIDALLLANQVATGKPPPQITTVTIVYSFAGIGLHGVYTSTDNLADGRFVNTLAVGPLTQIQGFDGEHAWRKDSSGEVTEQAGGDQRQAAVSEAYRQANLWWRSDRGGARIVMEAPRQDGGGVYDVLSVIPPGGEPFEAWFDAGAHLLGRTVQKQGAQIISNTFLDYRRFEGVMQAQKVVLGPAPVDTLTMNTVKYLDGNQAVSFSPPRNETTDASIADGRRETSLPFRLVDNRVYGDVRVGGAGPFLFLFDTGASDSITSILADTLGLTAQGRAQEAGAGEGVAETGFTKVPDIEIADARVKDQVFQVGYDALADVEGLDDKGVIGFDVFRRFVTRIDYPRGVITLMDEKTFDAKDAGTPVHFDFEGNVIEVAGDFEGIPAKFIIDTGSRAELVLNTPFAERNGLRSTHPKGLDVVAGWGTGGPSRAYATRGARLDIGPIQIPNVVTFLSTEKKGVFAGSDFDGAIGGGVLKRFVVTLDYRRQTLYLKPAETPQADVGAFDRAGMWFNRSPTGFTVVDVAPDSPAARAGLAPGDQIVSVDGTSAQTMNVYDLRFRLRNEPAGSVVKFGVRRNGRLETSDLTLKDLI